MHGNLPHSTALHLCNIENINEAAFGVSNAQLSYSGEKRIMKITWQIYLCVICFPPSPPHSLADVFSSECHVAGLTSEAADVPLFLQRQERLTLLDLGCTSGTVCAIKRIMTKRWMGKERKRGRMQKENIGNTGAVEPQTKIKQSEPWCNCTSSNSPCAPKCSFLPLWHNHRLNQ